MASCMGVAIKEHIVNDYFLIATDLPNDCDFTYQDSPPDGNTFVVIVPATVFAVGFNNQYLIVKQHPRVFPDPPNKKVTNYYIIPNHKTIPPNIDKEVIGPLTLEQFNQKRKELNIESIQFTKVIKELE
jgi:hypothetical protein